MKDEPHHLRHIDGLRCVLALYVVMHHVLRTVNANPSIEVDHWWGWLRFGRLAVDGFIVVSGYCLMLPVARAGGILRRGTRSFYWGRCRRILPALFAAIGLNALAGLFPLSRVTGTPWDDCIPITVPGLVGNLALLGDFLQSGKVNYVFWSVALEWRIYLLFPVLVWLFRRFGQGRVTVVTLLITTTCAALATRHEATRNNFGYFGLFVLGTAGVGIDWVAVRQRLPWATPANALIAGIVAGVSLLCAFQDRLLHNPLFDLLVAGITLACLAECRVDGRSFVCQALQWPPLVVIGGFSYSLYLVHAPVLQLLWQYAIHPLGLRPGVEFALLAGSAVPGSIVAAYVFSLAFERPFLSRRQPIATVSEAASPPVSTPALAPFAASAV